jgi:hypothetical protein
MFNDIEISERSLSFTIADPELKRRLRRRHHVPDRADI